MISHLTAVAAGHPLRAAGGGSPKSRGRDEGPEIWRRGRDLGRMRLGSVLEMARVPLRGS